MRAGLEEAIGVSWWRTRVKRRKAFLGGRAGPRRRCRFLSLADGVVPTWWTEWCVSRVAGARTAVGADISLLKPRVSTWPQLPHGARRGQDASGGRLRVVPGLGFGEVAEAKRAMDGCSGRRTARDPQLPPNNCVHQRGGIVGGAARISGGKDLGAVPTDHRAEGQLCNASLNAVPLVISLPDPSWFLRSGH